MATGAVNLQVLHLRHGPDGKLFRSRNWPDPCAIAVMSGKFKHLLVGICTRWKAPSGGLVAMRTKQHGQGGRFRLLARYAILIGGAATALAGCAGTQNPPPLALTGPPPKPSISPSDVIGRWELGAYHRAEDRARTEAITKGQCNMPYVIGAGNEGTVTMLTHDSPTFVEVQIKANQEGRTFIGPGPELGGPDDREVMSYNGRVLILRWTDPEVAGRYGTQLLVRCAPKA